MLMNNKKNEIEHMCSRLEQAIKKCDKDIVEGFECQEICTGKSNKSVLDSNETKSLILIVSLIIFYGLLKR